MKRKLVVILLISILFTVNYPHQVKSLGQQVQVESLLKIVHLSSQYGTQIKFSLSGALLAQNVTFSSMINDKILINGKTVRQINAFQSGAVEAYWDDNETQPGQRDGYFVLHLFILKSLGEYGLKMDDYDTIEILDGFTTAKGDAVSVTQKYGCSSSGIWYPFTTQLSTSQLNGTIDIKTSPGWQITDTTYNSPGDWEYRFGPSVILNPDNSIEIWSSARGLYSNENNYDDTGTMIPEHIMQYETVAQKFTARWAFDGLDVLAPSWGNNIGNLTLTLYRWDTDYTTSLAGSSVYTTQFIDFIDYTRLTINFDRQPAGDYIWTLTNPAENVGIYRVEGSNIVGNINYRNGLEVAGGDYASRIIDSLDKFNQSGNLTNVEITSTDTAAQKFVAQYDFNGVSVQCPSYGNNIGSLRFDLYRWDTDYATTIATTPLYWNIFTNYIDDSYIQMMFPPLQPDTFLWVLSKTGTGNVGVKKYASSAVTGNINYFNGNITTGDYKTRLSVCYWDSIKYKKSVDGGLTWGNEILVSKPTAGGSDALSNCDPGVVYFGGYYYLGYTSTVNYDGTRNNIFVERSVSPTGPFEKWNGSGWGGSPQPFITFDGPSDQWGIGEPSFVVKDGLLYVYYSYISGSTLDTRLATALTSDPNWPGSITMHGTAILRYSTICDSTDIKYVDSIGKFIAVDFYNRMNENPALSVYESVDGYNFYPSKNFMIYDNIRQYSHNLGISGTREGHLDTAQNNFIVHATGNWTIKPWNLFLVPISFNTDYKNLFALNMNGLSSSELQIMRSADAFQNIITKTTLPVIRTDSENYSFEFGDYNKDGVSDLYCIYKKGASGFTEVHILDGKTDYQTWIVNTATVLPISNTDWDFKLADYNSDGYPDIYCINKNNNGQTTLQIINGTFFNSFISGTTPIVLPYGKTSQKWTFDVATYDSDTLPDIIGIKQMGYSGKTEVHIIDGADFVTFSLHVATILDNTDEKFDFYTADYNHDGKLDIYCVFKSGSSGKTELHVLDGSTSYRSYLANIATSLPQTGAAWIFDYGLYQQDTTPPYVSGVINGGTNSGKTTVTFNEGSATLNGNAFTSGGQISATGVYHLSVVDLSNNNAVRDFSVIILGDVNGDGVINVSDISLMKHHLLNINLLEGVFKAAGDYNSKGKISISDILKTKKSILGI